MQPTASQPFSNLQLELLKVFSVSLSDEELLEVRRVLMQHFGQKATEAANQVWDEQGWTDEKVDELLNTKLRARRGRLCA